MNALRKSIAAGVVAAALALAGCSGGGASPEGEGAGEPLKIAVISPFSGAMAAGGIALAEGYQLAIDEFNSSGGVLGRQIELIRGDAGTPEAAIAEVDRLSTSQGVEIFVGTYTSGTANTASEAALRNGRLYWDTTALAVDLTDRGLANYVRSGPSAKQFAEVSVDYLVEVIAPALEANGEAISVCLTHEDSIYGQSVADIHAERLAAEGIEVADRVAYSAASPDLSSVVLRCSQAQADVWLTTGYANDNNLLLQSAKQQGFLPRATMLVATGDTAETSDALGNDVLEGVFVTAYAHNDTSEEFAPGITDFLAAYDETFGGEPMFGQTLGAYSGMKLLLTAVDEAGAVDPGAVRDVLAAMDEPLGSLPAGYGVKFDDTFQNTLALPTVVQWQSGATVTVYPEAAAAEGAATIGLD